MHLSIYCTPFFLIGLAFLCQNASAAPRQQVPKSIREDHTDCSKTSYNILTSNLSSNEVPFRERVALPDQRKMNTSLKANQTVAPALDPTKTFPNFGPTTIWPVTSDFYLVITIGAASLPEPSVDALLNSAYRTAEKKPSSGLLTEKYENRIPSRWTRALDIVLDVSPALGSMTWEDFTLAMRALWEFYHRPEDPPPHCTFVYFQVRSRSRGILGMGTLRRGFNSLLSANGAADGTVSNGSLTSRLPRNTSKSPFLLLSPAAV